MVLVVNIGNTNIRFGIFNTQNECINSWIVNTKPYKTSDELYINFNSTYHHYGINPKDIHKIVIGSVVPPLTQDVVTALSNLHNITPILVDRNTVSQIKHKSNQLGTDLYANCVAGHRLYKGNKIIIDFGTALTFTAISEKGEMIGVSIAPGIQTSLDALIRNTAQLSSIELKQTNTILGLNTEHCMQSGVVYGFLSMVEGMIQRIKKEINDESAFVIATGGLGGIFYPLTTLIGIYDQLHTIKGLYFLESERSFN